MKAEDKELEAKLRWIFENYGKDLQAFFRDAQAAGLNVKPESGPYTACCLKCGHGHNKAFGFCLNKPCDGKMGERKDALPAALKLSSAAQEPQDKCCLDDEGYPVHTLKCSADKPWINRICKPQEQEGAGE